MSFFLYRRLAIDLPDRLEAFMERRGRVILLCILIVYISYYLTTILLRYYTHHTQFFDFGIYDWRIWLIYSIPWSGWMEKVRSSLNGHFQPVLVLYSVLYDAGFDPVVLNLFQAVFVISGALPLYLLAKRRLSKSFLTTSVILLYLLYPATQFNIAIDFHPDHLIIPLFFWAYYFVEIRRYGRAFLLAAAGFLIKEPFMLAAAFFGIYMVWERKRYAAGISLFLISFAVFLVTVFFVSSSLNQFRHHESITGAVAYGYLFEPSNISGIIKEIFRFEKWRFPLFLLAPLLFAPLLSYSTLLSAFPLIAIQLLSTSIHHQNVASQYTAGIIPAVFVALVYALQYIEQKFGRRMVIAIFTYMFILGFAFNTAHSPSPFAVAFWDKGWSHGRWHYTNYLPAKNFNNINSALAMIPENPEVRVVTHSLIYDKRLAHRYSYSPFPERWRQADYILLDNSLEPYVSDAIDEGRYRKNLTELSVSREFNLIYKKGSVVLYKRRAYGVRTTTERTGAP